MRRLEASGDDTALVDVEIVTRKPILARLVKPGSGEVEEAIFISSAGADEASLVTRIGTCVPGQSRAAQFEGAHRTLEVRQIAERGVDFELVRCRISEVLA